MQKTTFWAIYHIILICCMFFLFLKQETCGVCFNGFLLIYTQQRLLAEIREEGE